MKKINVFVFILFLCIFKVNAQNLAEIKYTNKPTYYIGDTIRVTGKNISWIKLKSTINKKDSFVVTTFISKQQLGLDTTYTFLVPSLAKNNLYKLNAYNYFNQQSDSQRLIRFFVIPANLDSIGVTVWGINYFSTSNVPAGLKNVVQISAGGGHNLALRADGSVVAWGDIGVPAGLDSIVQVSAGVNHSLALRADGTVISWGNNMQGQSSTPVGLNNVVYVGNSDFGSMAIKADGSVTMWGYEQDSVSYKLKDVKNAIQVEGNNIDIFALKADGTIKKVKADGGNVDYPITGNFGIYNNVIQISAKNARLIFLMEDSTVLTQGYYEDNANGGFLYTLPQYIPNKKAIQVTAGYSHNLALQADGTVFSWGLNENNQLNIPMGLSGVTQISAGYYYSVVLNKLSVYTVANEGGTISSSNLKVKNGDNVRISYQPNTGYVIDSIFINEGYDTAITQDSLTGYTFTNINSFKNIRVKFVKTVKIYASAGLNGKISDTGFNLLKQGANKSFIITPNNGYVVDSIFVDDTFVGNNNIYQFNNVTQNHILRVTFKIPNYLVSVTAGAGGTISSSGNIYVEYGRLFPNYIITPNIGYEIDSFKVNGVNVPINNNIYSLDSIKSNITIRVTFKLQKFSVLTSVGIGGKISIGDTSINYGSILSILITPNVGYEIDSFKVNGVKVNVSNNNYLLDSIKQNTTISASFKLQKFRVLTSVGIGGKISVRDTSINYGSNLPISITPNVGYQIDSLIINNNKINSVNTFQFNNIRGDSLIRVTFKLQTFTITASVGTGVNISNLGSSTVNYGDRPTYTFTLLPSYIIDSLSVFVNDVIVNKNNIINSTYTFDSVKSNQTIFAKVRTQKINITALAGIGGNISPQGITSVFSGDSQEFIITPNIGYLIDSLFINDTLQIATNRVILSNIVANSRIYVKFKQIPFTLSVSAGNFGTISSLGTSIVGYGDRPTFNITPNDGYVLDSLIVNGVKINNITNVFTLDSVKSNQTIRVTFIENFNKAFLYKNTSFQSTTNSTGSNGDYINLPTLILDSNYTVETWFNLNPSTGTSYPFIYNFGGWGNNSSNSNGLIINISNRNLNVRSWGIEANAGLPPNNLTGYSLVPGIWTHLAMVVRGRNTKVYVNGNLIKEYISLGNRPQIIIHLQIIELEMDRMLVV